MVARGSVNAGTFFAIFAGIAMDIVLLGVSLSSALGGSPYQSGSLHNAMYAGDAGIGAIGWTESDDGVQWKELTQNGHNGLIGGILRLNPGVNIHLHYHQSRFGESYYFTKGGQCGGFVHIGEVVRPSDYHRDAERGETSHDSVTLRIVGQYPIREGLFVNIPAGAVHGISVPLDAEEPCEFVWHFPTDQQGEPGAWETEWRNIAYLYVHPSLSARNVEGHGDSSWYREYLDLKVGKRRLKCIAVEGSEGINLTRLHSLCAVAGDHEKLEL